MGEYNADAADGRAASWTPIISDASGMCIDAWSAIEDISRAVLTKDYLPATDSRRQHRTYEEAVLYGYLCVATGEEEWLAKAVACLNEAIDSAHHWKDYIGLYGGLCGLGWTIEHLEDSVLPALVRSAMDSDATEEASVDVNAEIDEAVIRIMQRERGNVVYDLISGLVGWGVYFLERLPVDRAVTGVQYVIDQLGETCQETRQGITWHTAPELLPEWQRKRHPNGYYNLGVAHGIPGVIYLLNEAVLAGIAVPKATALLEGAMTWLLNHRRPNREGAGAHFAAWIADGEHSVSRFAWCYGDPGVLSILLRVAETSHNRRWKQESDVLLESCLALPPESAGVTDAPLCHGAAGIAHIFNRIYQRNGDVRCRGAAEFWFRQVLEMRRPGSGVAGYSAFTRPDPAGPVVWEPTPAFLDGASGVALSLLSAVTDIPPMWDRVLLLSGRDAR